MKIVLFGYGKMGKIIEEIALKRGHSIHLIVDENNQSRINNADLEQADVAIDFSTPEAVLTNINMCFEADLPLVIGTTGWYDHLSDVRTTCTSRNKTLLYGSNFSIGVNIMFHVNKMLAKAMANYSQYDVQIEEIHHTQKLDSPSGTAISLANGILDQVSDKNSWVNYTVGYGQDIVPKKDELLIESLRIEDVPGTHTVLYSSDIDQIELKHVAHNRSGFAFGAVIAAEWLHRKHGFYEVTEMFDFS